MPVQTTYGDLNVAFAGQLANINPQEIVSLVAEGAVGFGFPVVRGTADNQGIIPTATGGSFVGVAVYTLASDSTSETGYADKEIMSVIRSGYVYVKVEEAISAGDAVYFVHTGNVGQYRNDANTDKADAITGATFETSAVASGYALVRLK